MIQRLRVILGLVLMLTSTAAPFPIAMAAGADIPASLHLISVSFVDQNHGWLADRVSGGTLIFRTSNGGRTWTGSTVPVLVERLDFVTRQQGWMVGIVPVHCPPSPNSSHCQQVLLHTVDGGRHWERQLTLSDGYTVSVSQFLNASLAWFTDTFSAQCGGCNRHIYGTVDGGHTWQQRPAGPPITSLYFVNARDGWKATDSVKQCASTIWITHDGGQTWIPQVRTAHRCTFFLNFASPRLGWALLSFSPDYCSMSGCVSYTLYHTSDGGLHWSIEQRPTTRNFWWRESGFPSTMHFASPQIGWIPFMPGAGSGVGGILVTRDGGRSWSRSLQRYGVNDVSTANPQHAWLIGCTSYQECPVLWHTTDAGRTWTQSQPRTLHSFGGAASRYAPCRAQDLRAAAAWQGAAGQRVGGVVLTNHSSHACVLQGRPYLDLIDASGKHLRVTRHAAPLTPGLSPGVPPRIQRLGLILPNHRAVARLQWSNWCGGSIRLPVAVRINLPHHRGRLTAPARSPEVNGKLTADPPPCLGPTLPSTLWVSPFYPVSQSAQVPL